MRKTLAILGFVSRLGLLITFVLCAGAQQIPLTGAIGVPGSAAILGYRSIVMTDANRTLTPVEWAHSFIKVTSSASLTVTRSLVLPLNSGQQFVIYNNTTGGRSILVGGASGATVVITNGSTALIQSDGVNYTTTPLSLQANAPGTVAIQGVISDAGSRGSVIIPANNPPLVAPGFNNIVATAACGTLNANTTYTYAITANEPNGVQSLQLPISVTTGGGSNNYCVSFGWSQVGSIPTYTIYGRIAGSEGVLDPACNFFNAGCKIDTGSVTPGGALPPNSWTNPNSISIDSQVRGSLGYRRALPLDMYGCLGDGLTDDTDCWNAAVAAAIATGVNAIEATPFHTYIVNKTLGGYPLPRDYGECPSGSTVGGSACTNLSPESQVLQAYSIWLPNNFIIYGNNAIVSSNNSNIPSPSIPAIFLCEANLDSVIEDPTNHTPAYPGCQGLQIYNLNVNGGTTPLFVAGTLSFSYFNNFNSTFSAFAAIIQTWDKNTWSNSVLSDKSGVTIGDWWVTRGNLGTNTPGGAIEQGGYCDGCNFNNVEFEQYNAGAFLTDAPAVNAYFTTYFYKAVNNTNGRLTDVQGTSSPTGGYPTAAPFVGVYGNGLYVGGRSLRPDNGEIIQQFQGKAVANYLIYFAASINSVNINTTGSEAAGFCFNGGDYIVGDPINCPNPYSKTGGPNTSDVYFNSGGYGFVQSSSTNSASSGISTENDQNGDVFILRGAFTPNPTVNSAPPSAKFKSYGSMYSSPGTGSGHPIPDIWNWQSNPNTGVSYGGYYELTHMATGALGSTGFGARVPYMILAPDVLAAACDGPATGYIGHGGWFRYIAGTSGVSDQVQVCSKNSSNAYSWTTISPFYLSNNPAHILTGSVSPTDLGGTLTAVSGTATYTFIGTLTAPPYCLVEDDTLFTNLLTKTVTSTTLTVTTTGPTDSVTYHCFGSTGSY